MRALVLEGIGDLALRDAPKPRYRDDEVLLRVSYSGVCGSDIPRIFTKGTYKFPTICGHEFAGVVAKVGAGVDGWRAGDRAAVFPLLWCGKCAACERGRYVQCHDYDYLGSRSDGGFAEYVPVPVRNLVALPDSVSLKEAAMTEPASVALHAIRRAGGCGVGDTVAIFGAGPIGIMVGQWARALGVQKVFFFDIATRKLDLARSLGFSDAWDSREKDPVALIDELTHGNGVNIAIDAAGVPQTLRQAIAVAGREGKVVALGNPSADVTIPAPLLSQMMRREVSLLGTWNSEFSACGNRDDWRDTIAAIATGQLNLKPLITHTVNLDDAPETLQMMREGNTYYSKVLIQP